MCKVHDLTPLILLALRIRDGRRNIRRHLRTHRIPDRWGNSIISRNVSAEALESM